MADSLADAVARLLRIAPDSWADVPKDLSSDENTALYAITAAGFIERRTTFTVRLPGEEQAQRITIEATGEFGVADAMQSVVQDWLARWGKRWQTLREELGEPIKPIVTRDRDEWRLTEPGRLAKGDLERGEQRPVDFALKRGFFDGTPRLLPDGRLTRRELVRGHGRLVSIETVEGKPLAVDVAGFSAAPELAQAFAKALEPFWRAAPPLQVEKPAAEYVFRRDGDGWFVRAFGKEGHFQNLKGFEYIAKLLACPHKPVPMVELIGSGDANATATLRAVVTTDVPQAVLDTQGRRSLETQLRQLVEEIEAAEKHGDSTLAELYRKEFQTISEQLGKDTTPKGQPRNFATNVDKLRARIANALRRAYDVLRNGEMRDLANHLETSIDAQGDCFVYSPSPQPTWVL